MTSNTRNNQTNDPVLTIRHCARVFVLIFTRRLFLRSSVWKGILSSIASSVLYIFWENLWHEKVNLNISELSAENGVAVVNAYGSIIGDNEDHVDDSTTAEQQVQVTRNISK
mgnify:CR=1 FL=1